MPLTEGIHSIPLADYLADPAPVPSMSRGIAQALIEQSPAHAWAKHPRLNKNYEPDHDKKYDLGTAVHDCLLEGNTGKILVVDAVDWRTKVAQDTRKEAYAAGKTPVLIEQMTEIELMVDAAKEALAQSELADVFTPEGGESEQTVIWKEGPVWLRTRPDRLSKDRRIIVDYKTTVNAEPNDWMKGPMLNNGCDLQAALGLRGVTTIAKPQHCVFVFIVQEVSPPYAVSFIGFGPQFEHYADARLTMAIKVWDRCLATGMWPGYPSRVAWVSPPEWKKTEWDNQISDFDDPRKEPDELHLQKSGT